MEKYKPIWQEHVFVFLCCQYIRYMRPDKGLATYRHSAAASFHGNWAFLFISGAFKICHLAMPYSEIAATLYMTD